MEALAKVKTEPDTWFRVAIFDSIYGAGNMRNRLRKRHGLTEFALVTRTLGDGQSGLWARYRSPQ